MLHLPGPRRPFCAFLTFLIWSLVCPFVSFLVALLLSIRTTPPVYERSLRFLPSRAPFSPQHLYFFLVSLTNHPWTRLSKVVHWTVSLSLEHLSAHTAPNFRSWSTRSWKRPMFRSGCLPSSLDPFVFGIPHPPFFCGGLVTGRLVTSCASTRGPKVVPASNERLTLHAVLSALPSYPTTLLPEISARALANAPAGHCTFLLDLSRYFSYSATRSILLS